VSTINLIQGLLLAFALVVILMPPYIRMLRFLSFGKQIREESPETHIVKLGTPTMGGLLIIGVVGLLAFLLDVLDASTYPPIAALLGVGVLGAADDYLNAKTGEGISVRQKFLWQFVVAVAAALYIQNHFDITGIRVPFVGDVIIGPVPYIVFAVIAIVGASNGVNITDGLDGLAGGTLIFAYVAFMIIALLNVPHQPNLAVICALIIGATLGFLWFNVHPAQLFMGDAGALSLGATLAVVATITGQLPLLAVIGVMMSRTWTVFSVEAFVPTWYESMGYPASFYGPLATTVVLSSAAGTVGCGSLADRFGRRAVTIGSLILTIPITLLFVQFTGPLGFLSGAILGLSAASTGPLMLVIAQQLMAGRAGMASGMILGLGFVTGAIGVPITGMLADAFGMQTAIEAQVLLVLATIGLALLLPSEARMAALARRAEAAS